MQKYSKSDVQVEDSFSELTHPWNISWVNDPPMEEDP